MTSPDTRFPDAVLNLSTPPEPVAIGIGVHGLGTRSDRFLLPELWSLHLYTYSARLILGAREVAIRPGFASITPAGWPVEYLYEGRSLHIYAHFRPAPGVGSIVSVPLIQDLGERFAPLFLSLERLAIEPTLPPARRTAGLWDALWQLAPASPISRDTSPNALHPAVRQTLARIERGLAETLSVRKLAADAGVSYSYLSRLFQKEMGESVVGHIASRRMERARYLLTESTLPVKSVAATVGIPDLHLFNKTVRKHHGVAPRQLRGKVEGTRGKV